MILVFQVFYRDGFFKRDLKALCVHCLSRISNGIPMIITVKKGGDGKMFAAGGRQVAFFRTGIRLLEVF